MEFYSELVFVLLAIGGIMNWIQTAHLKSNFLAPWQFRIVSVVGLMCFLSGTFVACKGIFL